MRTVLAGRPRASPGGGDLGLDADASPLASLQEAEDPALTRALDLAALQGYAAEVHDDVAAALAQVTAELEARPPAASGWPRWAASTTTTRPGSRDVGRQAGGLVRPLGADRPRAGHVGEMVSVRDRLGFRPF